jgi:hypothetical protein
LLRIRNHLNGQPPTANLGGDEAVEIPFHGRNVEFGARREAAGNGLLGV